MLAGQTDGRDTLANGTVLRDYTVEAVLGRGGFGIVYKARHNELDLVVAIKEYLPSELAVRESATVRAKNASCKTPFTDGLRRFRDEAKALIDFQNHPNVIDCRDFFRLNGTAYLVMEYADGLPLSELLREREEERKPFGELELLAVMVPLLEGLTRVHKAEVLHRDIKPSNILVSRSLERPVLIDFGAAKQGVADRSKSLAPYTEGYAALEHVGDGKLGPWTDVYALGAVMWRMVAGGNRPWEPPNPVKVETRANAALRGAADPMPPARELGAGRISPEILESIDRCLTLSDGERVRGCGELLELLQGAGPAKEEAGSEPRAATPVPVSKRQAQARKKNAPRVALATGVAAAACLVWFLLASGGGADSAGVDAEFSSRAGAEPSRLSDGSEAESLRANTEVSRGVAEEVAGGGQRDSPGKGLDSDQQEPQVREPAAREAPVDQQAQPVPTPVRQEPRQSGQEPRIDVQGQEREASRKNEAAEAAWEEVKGTERPEVLAAFIAKWERTDGAAGFVGRAKTRMVDLAYIQASKKEREAEAAWERARSMQNESLLVEYIAEWEDVPEAAEFVSEARVRLRSLAKIVAVKEKEDSGLLSDLAEAYLKRAKRMQSEQVLATYIAQWEDVAEAAEFVNEARDHLHGLAKSQAVKEKEDSGLLSDLAEAYLKRVKRMQSEQVLATYIAQWEDVAEAAEFVNEARDHLRGLAKSQAVKERKDGGLMSPGRRFQDCAVCPQMVVLPAGDFIMGSPRNEKGRDGDEGPRHRVTIPAPFAVGIYEVTFEEWEACVFDRSCSRDPSDEGWGRDRQPVIHMSWVDTQEYVTWLSQKTGKRYRLLSEAEWEYAARAGTQTRYGFGNEISRDQANYDPDSSRILGKTDRVGLYPPNRFGLHDMHGNVWEWVQDCWNGSYVEAPTKGQAWLSGNCSLRVLRGGSWYSGSGNLRSADRHRGPIRSRVDSGRRGFRVARALDP